MPISKMNLSIISIEAVCCILLCSTKIKYVKGQNVSIPIRMIKNCVIAVPSISQVILINATSNQAINEIGTAKMGEVSILSKQKINHNNENCRKQQKKSKKAASIFSKELKTINPKYNTGFPLLYQPSLANQFQF